MFITRSVVAALVIVGTVALSLGASVGLSVLVWQHLLGINNPVVAVRMPSPGSGRQGQFMAVFVQALEQAGWRSGAIGGAAGKLGQWAD